MGFLKKKEERESMEELEEKRDYLVLKEEVVTKEAEVTEREIVIAELKKKYGKGWAKTLGVSKFTDLTSLRAFLVSAKHGIESSAKGRGTPGLAKKWKAFGQKSEENFQS